MEAAIMLDVPDTQGRASNNEVWSFYWGWLYSSEFKCTKD